MKRVWWGLSAGFAIIVALFLAAPSQAAYKPNGLQVSPLRAYPNQNPGTTTHGSLTLTNYTDQPQTVDMSVETFQVTGTNYRYTFNDSEATKWVQYDQPVLSLKPKEAKVVNYSIAVPANATPGGKYLALISSVGVQNTQNITEIHRVASLVYLQVNGAISLKGQLVAFDMPRFTTKRAIPTNIKIANTGNSHFESRVGFYVRTIPGPGKGGFLSQIQGYILPGTVRQLDTTLYTFAFPGMYRFTAEYQPPTGSIQRLTSDVLYIPWWFVGVCLVSLVLLGLLAWRYFHHRPTFRSKE